MSIDQDLFTALTGHGSVPTIGQNVMYFPPAHEAISWTTTDFSSFNIVKPYALYNVSRVKFLISNESEELFARIILKPAIAQDVEIRNDIESRDEIVAENSILVFSRMLNTIDLNPHVLLINIPVECAESIFADVEFGHGEKQEIQLSDMYDHKWSFEYYKRGDPPRYLLGGKDWPLFVQSKGLQSEDKIVFAKRERKFLVGIRRRKSHENMAEIVVKVVEAIQRGISFTRASTMGRLARPSNRATPSAGQPTS